MLQKKIKTLLVEDDNRIAQIIEKTFRDFRYAKLEIEWVQNLNDAVKMIDKHDFDIILLDLGLPDSQGLETFKTIHNKVSHLPVIILTGLDDESIAVKAIHNGAQDFLVKGQINVNLLKHTLLCAIERNTMWNKLKQYNTDLQLSKNQFRKIVETIKNGIIVVDKDLQIQFLNDSAKKIFANDTKIKVDQKYTYEIIPGKISRMKVPQADEIRIIEKVVREIYLDEEKKYIIYLEDITGQNINREKAQSISPQNNKDKMLKNLIGETTQPLQGLINYFEILERENANQTTIKQCKKMIYRISELIRSLRNLIISA